MPELDGLQTASSIRKNNMILPNDQPFIAAVTANAFTEGTIINTIILSSFFSSLIPIFLLMYCDINNRYDKVYRSWYEFSSHKAHQ